MKAKKGKDLHAPIILFSYRTTYLGASSLEKVAREKKAKTIPRKKNKQTRSKKGVEDEEDE